MKGTIQTRDEHGGLNYFLSLHEAFEEIEKDKSIWKVSYESTDGQMVRMIRNAFDLWENKPLMVMVVMELGEALQRLLQQQRKDVGGNRWPTKKE